MMNSSIRSALPQVLAVSVKNIVLIGFGMSLGFPTILIPSLQEKPGVERTDDLSLNKVQISWISSLNLICVPLGCVFSGSFASLIGRRRAMQLVNIPIFLSWIIFFYSQHVYYLYIALCLSGFTGGMLEAPVLTYVAEISVPKLRGMLSATGSSCIILGIFSQFLFGTFIGNWRTITLVSSCVPIIAIILLCFVPESPHWLILKNRDEDAKKSLMWLRGWTNSFESVKNEFEELKNSLSSRCEQNGKRESVINEFAKRTFWMPYLICSLSFFIGHFSGMTTLQTYAVIIFTSLNAPIDKYFATTILGCLELIGTIVCVIFVKFVGKRKLSFFSMIGCGICFLLTAIYAFVIRSTNEADVGGTEQTTTIFFEETTELSVNMTEDFFSNLQASPNNVNDLSFVVKNQDLSKYSWVPLSLLLTSALLSHCGIRLLPWMLVGEVFPGNIRGISSGLSGGTGYIFGFLANKLFLTMVSSLSLPGTFILYSVISFIGCLLLFILLPETENRTLLEIEDHFAGKKKLGHKLVKTSSIAEPFPSDFDVKTWKSNEKFERYLQRQKEDQTTTQKSFKKPPKSQKIQKTINENDIDTRL